MTSTDRMAIAVLVLLAVATRFLWLDRESIWLDETASLFYANRLLQEGWLTAFTAGQWHDPHPPLYPTLLGVWIEHFGTSETALRSFSAVFGVLLVIATWYFCRAIAGSAAAILCGVLVVANPLLLYYAQEARMYAPVALLMMLATYYWYRLDRRLSVAPAILYVLIAAAMLYTHYLTAFVVAAHFAWSLAGVRRMTARRELTKLAVVGGCVALIFLPWAMLHLARPPLGAISWMSAPSFPDLAKSLLAVTGIDKSAGHLLGADSTGYRLTAWLTLLVVLAGAVRAWRHGPAGRLVVAVSVVPLVLVALSHAWTPVFNTRQASVYSPFAALLITFALYGGGSPGPMPAASRRGTRAAGVAAITAWSIVGAYGCWLTLFQLEKPNWRGLARSLEERPASTPIVVHQWYVLNTLKYYYRGHAPLHGLNRERLGRLGEITAEAPRVVLVISHANPQQALEALDDDYRAGKPHQHTWMKVVELERRD